jgi:hypothetical protein
MISVEDRHGILSLLRGLDVALSPTCILSGVVDFNSFKRSLLVSLVLHVMSATAVSSLVFAAPKGSTTRK